MEGAGIVQRINTILANKGISKAEFYKNCDLTSSAYSQWKTGKTKPSLDKLRVVANYLGCTIGDLTDDENYGLLVLDGHSVLRSIGIDFGNSASSLFANMEASAGAEPDPETEEIMARIGTLTKRQKKIFLAQLRMLDEEEDPEK